MAKYSKNWCLMSLGLKKSVLSARQLDTFLRMSDWLCCRKLTFDLSRGRRESRATHREKKPGSSPGFFVSATVERARHGGQFAMKQESRRFQRWECQFIPRQNACVCSLTVRVL